MSMNKSEEQKEKSDKKKLSKIPQSVISHYAKYRNIRSSIKSFLVMGTRFDIEDKFEIMDASKDYKILT